MKVDQEKYTEICMTLWLITAYVCTRSHIKIISANSYIHSEVRNALQPYPINHKQ